MKKTIVGFGIFAAMLHGTTATGEEQRDVLRVEQLQELSGEGGALGGFGAAISVDGDTAVVGAPLERAQAGSAYVFTRENGLWVRQTTLAASDGAEGDWFGIHVSLTGDMAVVGASRDDDVGPDDGSAYVFTRTDGTWVQEAKLLPDDDSGGGEDDVFGRRFGAASSVSGDTIVIGAPGSGGDEFGSAYVFTRTGDGWGVGTQLIGDDQSVSDGFGGSVSLDGDTLLIGAPGDDDSGPASGSAYVFTRTDGVWSLHAKLTPDDGAAGDGFGSDVSLDGNTAVIGANSDDDNGPGSGSAYVFTRTDGVWAQQAKLMPDDGAADDVFGFSVSLEGDTAMIGAVGYENDSGAAYAFIRSGNTWIQRAKILADHGAAGDLFGWASSSKDGTVMVGAVGDDSLSGSVHVFEISLVDAVDLLRELAHRVRSLNLHHGTTNALISKLDTALTILTDLSVDNDGAARNVLVAFTRHVEAQYGKKIPEDDADGLILEAREISGLLASR